MGVWKIERERGGAVEVFYIDGATSRTSCGRCPPSTPSFALREWLSDHAEPFDVLVEEDGREYVKLREAQRRN